MISDAGPGELVAAVGAAAGADDAGPAQLGEDVLQEILRDALAAGQDLALHGHPVGLDRGQLGRRSNRVVSLGCDPHRTSLADPRIADELTTIDHLLYLFDGLSGTSPYGGTQSCAPFAIELPRSRC